jgi:hypothetical protein
MTEEICKTAPTYSEIKEMEPEPEEMLEGGDHVDEWYEAAPLTAACIFVQAANESDSFRETFVANGSWREVMNEEVPEYYEKVMDLKLSAFQGGHAESKARKHLNE